MALKSRPCADCGSAGDGHSVEASGIHVMREKVHVTAGQPMTLQVVNRDG
jgi:hypothetical protein